jgi:hypothetical protein
MGQAVAPVSVTCSKWYLRKAPLSQCAAFGHESAELLLACLINLLPESFGALLVCLSPPERVERNGEKTHHPFSE